MSIKLEVNNNISEFLKKFERNQENVLKKIGMFCKSKMDVYVPVDTGKLRSMNDFAIKAKKTHKKARIAKKYAKKYGYALVLINECEYAVYQEYGTRKMKAQPFMRPSVHNHITEIKMIAARNMKL